MDGKKIFEEQLRYVACMGDTNGIEKLLNIGIDINTRHAINGWTPLHWACKKNYIDAVALLLKNGADKNIKSEYGETPRSLSTNPYILKLLDDVPDSPKSPINQDPDFIPNFVKNTSLNCKTNVEFLQQNIDNICQEIVLKLRIANTDDSDFIEVDVKRNDLTYQKLINMCCDELEINPSQIVRLRKLPNTKIRTNRDVQRLENFQEIEAVLFSPINITNDLRHKTQYTNGNTVSITPTNNYQSISKKDQTILY
ncbi:PREDICTED: ankyrin repeat domain-containing protein 40-like [Ceratosolen solmsi marchali]|uniref:Ankyrin repeat domain-containing protein 40-like n=1 Tax=Ceratosolen solmsi marchali TaxID=326594 RepID=A0AAJ6VKT9_9HYME|nr:PREDICTED: ankyrin repeat domain-containing protein 40-like [Ceratosolen solmsi marchali]